MNDLSEIGKVYFIGIGGIGMSALARFYQHMGKEVHGYDRDKTALTKKLEAEGMIIHYKIEPSKIPRDVDLVIYTPAIDESHAELKWCIENNYSVIKRAVALGLLSRTKKTLAIAGTHGKTTTSSILSHILTECNTGASALIGGIMVDYKGNFIYGDGDVLVTEADEYDRSFLELDTNFAAIMSMDSDHLDIYETHEQLIEAFEQFSLKLREGGKLFLKSGLISIISKSTILELNSRSIEIYDFGDEDARIYTLNHRVEKGQYLFDISYLGSLYRNLSSHLPGKHNAENASVAFAMAMELGLESEEVIKAIGSFNGIKRRFEKVLEKDEIIIIDDYAHHPTEINAAISTARMLYPKKKLTVVFQPHLYSRTKDFFEEFGLELSKADEVILTGIYPAREAPMEGVTSELIYKHINSNKKKLINKKDLLEILENREVEFLLILGAGDIDKMIKKVKKIYKK